ncbi:FadR/GntR family transcriptional regulator [Kineococcus sp. SYSU DK018]|uniref:FadR/GntR family transcriptional regulator n=1 Tax=Kineococcus sp. SYSU DK018 TaxID=3383139 RepID=UPI003D7CE6B1
MPRKSLVSQVAETILDQIVRGELPVGGPLPTEAELCAVHDVSRMTLREALKTLQAQNVVRAAPGVGSYVNPVEQWTGLEAVLRATSAGADEDLTSVQLVEVRRMIETGAAALAAERHGAADLRELEELLELMRDAHRREDLAAFVRADIGFHDAVLRASGNVFVALLLDPLSRVLREKREQTSAVPRIQANAIEQHALVLEALRSREPERARRAMDAHLQQTAEDLRRYVLDPPA